MVRNNSKSSRVQLSSIKSHPAPQRSRRGLGRAALSDTEVMEGDRAVATSAPGPISITNPDHDTCQPGLDAPTVVSDAGSPVLINEHGQESDNNRNRHPGSGDAGDRNVHESHIPMSSSRGHDQSGSVVISRNSGGGLSLAPSSTRQEDFELPPSFLVSHTSRPERSASMQQQADRLPETAHDQATCTKSTQPARILQNDPRNLHISSSGAQRELGAQSGVTHAPLLNTIEQYEATHPVPSPGSVTHPKELAWAGRIPGNTRLVPLPDGQPVDRGNHHDWMDAPSRRRGRSHPPNCFERTLNAERGYGGTSQPTLLPTVGSSPCLRQQNYLLHNLPPHQECHYGHTAHCERPPHHTYHDANSSRNVPRQYQNWTVPIEGSGPRYDGNPWNGTAPQTRQRWLNSLSQPEPGLPGDNQAWNYGTSDAAPVRELHQPLVRSYHWYNRRRDSSDSSSDDDGRLCWSSRGRRRTNQRRRPWTPSSSETDDAGRWSSEFGSGRTHIRSSQFRSHHAQSSHHPRFPPFTGQEPWKVWYNHFKDVAQLHHWTETEKLAELLPKLQGNAGVFVYELLSPDIRANFRELVRELKHRFHKAENPRTFMAQFSNRDQNQGERTEEYAAELKRLHDKAHSSRDPETRREDLRRRFLDGILDERARFQVEYVKEPDNIDDAVYEVVNFIETRKRGYLAGAQDRRNRKSTRAAKSQHFEAEDSHSESNVDSDREVRAVQNRGNRPKPGHKGSSNTGGLGAHHQQRKPQPTEAPQVGALLHPQFLRAPYLVYSAVQKVHFDNVYGIEWCWTPDTGRIQNLTPRITLEGPTEIRHPQCLVTRPELCVCECVCSTHYQLMRGDMLWRVKGGCCSYQAWGP